MALCVAAGLLLAGCAGGGKTAANETTAAEVTVAVESIAASETTAAEVTVAGETTAASEAGTAAETENAAPDKAASVGEIIASEREERYFQKDGVSYETVVDLVDGQYRWASAVGEGKTTKDSNGQVRPIYETQPRWFVNLDSGERIKVRRWDNLYYSAGDYLIYEYDGTMHVAKADDIDHPVLSYKMAWTYGIVERVAGGYMIADDRAYQVTYYDEAFKKVRTVENVRAGENGQYCRDGRIAVRDMESGLVGYLDEAGDFAIPCRYAYGSDFCNGYAAVLVDAELVPYTEEDVVQMFDAEGGCWAIIDADGNYALAPDEAYANQEADDGTDYYCGARRFSEVRSDGTVDFLDISRDNLVLATVQLPVEAAQQER